MREALEDIVLGHTIRLDAHDGRIGLLEIAEAITSTKLDITNKLLTVIAVMIGTGIVSFIVSLLK